MLRLLRSAQHHVQGSRIRSALVALIGSRSRVQQTQLGTATQKGDMPLGLGSSLLRAGCPFEGRQGQGYDLPMLMLAIAHGAGQKPRWATWGVAHWRLVTGPASPCRQTADPAMPFK